MASWFGKKKAPDGTNIVRHGNIETKLGVTTGTEGFGQAREAAYKRLFGEPVSVSHEVFPLVPHIDVYTFKRSQGNEEVYSLVTGGMSDLEMTLPRKADKDAPRRVELIFYRSEPRDEYISTLRWVAHFPHDNKSWLNAIEDAKNYKWFNQTLCKVNDSVVRVGIIEGEYHWHKHDNDDEFFFDRRRPAADRSRGENVELKPG